MIRGSVDVAAPIDVGGNPAPAGRWRCKPSDPSVETRQVATGGGLPYDGGMPPARERILFVTGRLAEPLVRRVAAEVAERAGFDFDVEVVGISVAALLHAEWLNRKLSI